MKRILLSFCIFLSLKGFAQMQSLLITTTKTTSLIFPFVVTHVDRGSRDVLIHQVKESENILLVKAAEKDFGETNLSVVTADGSIYGFVVNYAEKPSQSIYHLAPQNKFTEGAYANAVLDNPKTIHGIHDESWDMKASVKGIYIKDKTIYYQLDLNNQSPIDYDMDFVRFYIRDQKKTKRTASQEQELKPIDIAGGIKTIKANTRSVLVAALPRYTLPDQKILVIELHEKNGGRHLTLRIKNNKIIKAIPLPDMH